MTPQQKRVLQAAKAYNGTCSADWIDGLGADGKGKISRVPARIEELEDDHNCVFEVIGRRNKTKVFRLVSGPESPDGRGEGCPPPEHRTHAVVPTAVQCPGERLFTVGKGEFGFHNQEAAA